MKHLASRKAGPALALSVTVALLLIASPLHATVDGQKNVADFQRLTQKAWREGSVPVIVHLVVPDITVLTSASVDQPSGISSPAASANIAAADAQLKAAIDSVADTVLSDLRGTAFAVNHRYGSVPFIALRASAEAITALQNSASVLGIEEDLPLTLDPGEVADARNLAGGDAPQLAESAPLIGASTAWGWGFTGQGWYVAIIDTGIRKSHQMFTGKTIVEACFALGADAVGGAGDCPNGQAIMTGPGSAAHHPSTYQSFDHGTHVSGIAAGNSGTLFGVAKNANIIAVQVFSKVGSSVTSWNSDSMAGLDYVYSIRGTYKIASANMSLGGGGPYNSPCISDSRRTSVENLRAAGIATAIATGNNGWCNGVSAPACLAASVSVGSTTKSDAESSFSNWSAGVQKLFAPGSSINSSTGTSDSSYSAWNGTSMATPHVAGAWVLMKQVLPTGSVDQLLAALQSTGLGVTSVCDGRRVAIPRIRVDQAIASLAHYTLTIQASANGTTDPPPGAHNYPPGAQVPVTALPNTYADFVSWTGAATGSSNPVTVVMDTDKTVVANFQYIYPPNATGQRVLNRSFSQFEYVNVLTWQPNSANAGLTINKYRVYKVGGGTATLLAEVSASGSGMEYRHRNAGKDPATYAIVAVTGNSREGAPAAVNIQ